MLKIDYKNCQCSRVLGPQTLAMINGHVSQIFAEKLNNYRPFYRLKTFKYELCERFQKFFKNLKSNNNAYIVILEQLSFKFVLILTGTSESTIFLESLLISSKASF